MLRLSSLFNESQELILPPPSWDSIRHDLEDLGLISQETRSLTTESIRVIRLVMEDAKMDLLTKKYGFTAEQIEEIAGIDPTPNRAYLDWILRHVKNKNIVLPEDAEKVKEQLTQFTVVKRKSTYEGEKDINRLNPVGLYEIIEKYGNVVGKKEQVRTMEREGVKCLTGDATNGVWEITSAEAGSVAFRGTNWCVKDPKYFNQYDPKRYYMIVKDGGRICLYHPESSQLRNTSDGQMSFKAAWALKDFFAAAKLLPDRKSTLLRMARSSGDVMATISACLMFPEELADLIPEPEVPKEKGAVKVKVMSVTSVMNRISAGKYKEAAKGMKGREDDVIKEIVSGLHHNTVNAWCLWLMSQHMGLDLNFAIESLISSGFKESDLPVLAMSGNLNDETAIPLIRANDLHYAGMHFLDRPDAPKNSLSPAVKTLLMATCVRGIPENHKPDAGMMIECYDLVIKLKLKKRAISDGLSRFGLVKYQPIADYYLRQCVEEGIGYYDAERLELLGLTDNSASIIQMRQETAKDPAVFRMNDPVSRMLRTLSVDDDALPETRSMIVSGDLGITSLMQNNRSAISDRLKVAIAKFGVDVTKATFGPLLSYESHNAEDITTAFKSIMSDDEILSTLEGLESQEYTKALALRGFVNRQNVSAKNYIKVFNRKSIELASLLLTDMYLPAALERHPGVINAVKDLVNKIISTNADVSKIYDAIYDVYKRGIIDGKTIRIIQAMKRADRPTVAGPAADTSWNRVLN